MTLHINLYRMGGRPDSWIFVW